MLQGLISLYPGPYLCWAVVTLTALLPGVAAACAPALYRRHREAVIVACKLLVAALFPAFRLSWHAPGTPPDVRAAFGQWEALPLHPGALHQTGVVVMALLAIRHPLR